MNAKNLKIKMGFAFIEIMLSLVIIVLLCTGFASLVIKRQHDLKESFTQRALDEQQSKALFNNFKLLANYPDSPNPNYEQIYRDQVSFFPDNSQIIKGSNRDYNGSDTILVRYHGNEKNNIFNCLGTPIKTGQVTESLFYIDNRGKLACSHVDNGAADMKSPNILIEDVEVMQIRYGEDTDHDGVANRYVPANFPDLSYDRVVSIKICLLAKTGENINPLLASKYYQLDDVEFGPFTDHYARRILTFNLPINAVTQQNVDAKQ